MKMAEYDWDTRTDKASARILQLLASTIIEVVDFGKQPPHFDNVQFAIFDIARSKQAGYTECREIVEWSSQLLFAFETFGVQTAIDVLKMMAGMMMEDISPTEIQFAVFDIIRKTSKQWDRENLLTIVSNFITQLIVDGDDITYR
jgi:triphosphoribosyl-dephospho-CoA synthetase